MNERNALAVAALTSITWGLTGIFVRLLPGLSPLAITAGRLLIGLATVLPLLLVLRDTRRKLIPVLAQPLAYVLALLLAGYYLLATAAFQMAPVAEAALLLNTPPLFVLAFRWVRGTAPARAEVGGALLALAGMSLILGPNISLTGETSDLALLGHLCAICAAALTALYASIYRALSDRNRAPDAAGVAALTFAIGSAILILVLSQSATPSGLFSLDCARLWVLLGLGVISTAIPTVCFALVSRRLPPMVTATISLFIPLFAGFFAFLILGETISLLFVAGCVLVLGGATMIIRQNRV